MYPGCSPSRILSNHPKDQSPNFLRRLSSSHLRPGPGDQPPVSAETDPVPPDYSLRCNYDQRLFPLCPEPTDRNPEELVEPAYSGLRMPTLQHGELLA
jgi:hypothetical protein